MCIIHISFHFLRGGGVVIICFFLLISGSFAKKFTVRLGYSFIRICMYTSIVYCVRECFVNTNEPYSSYCPVVSGRL